MCVISMLFIKPFYTFFSFYLVATEQVRRIGSFFQVRKGKLTEVVSLAQSHVAQFPSADVL